MKEPILLVGAGGHAAACIDVIEQHGGYTIAGLIGVASEVGREVAGYPVIGVDTDLQRLRGIAATAIVTIGQIKTPEPRRRLFDELNRLGFRMPSIVSPLAYVSRHATVGEGTVVLHRAVINARARVGCNCIINTLALIEHDVYVGDHCHVATHAAINSGVSIGDETFIGSNATVRQGMTIGRRCVIGMGQRVLHDCADGTIIKESRS